MKDREQLFAYLRERYAALPEYPWKRSPSYAVFRHEGSQKWFAAVLDIHCEKLGLTGGGKVDAVNVKCDPLLAGTFRSMKGVFPAYHMNKEHWLTVLLDGTVQEDVVKELLQISYELTR